MAIKALVKIGACAVIGFSLSPIFAASATVSNEEIALSLATLLRSSRAVVSDKQKHINNPAIGHKGLIPKGAD
ncbi:MAG: hypothetical protein O7A03_11260 [Alphaproteobacteria bacterium]|nr:hypothetical protein [Alphaproteobacteria bacterium]